jgi:hypothetical protein
LSYLHPLKTELLVALFTMLKEWIQIFTLAEQRQVSRSLLLTDILERLAVVMVVMMRFRYYLLLILVTVVMVVTEETRELVAQVVMLKVY